jgi:predicted ATPase/class 3 adenylate cyclase
VGARRARKEQVPSIPTGTVTFLFTDIQGSTKLWQTYPEKMRVALARHDAILREAIEKNNGWVFKTVGDAFCASFGTALDALAAAIESQLALKAEAWDLPRPILVRAALHTGEAEERDGDYFGQALNRVARLLSIGHGGQVLLSLITWELVRDTLPDGLSIREMGAQRLKDLTRPESVYQIVHPRLSADFPPLNSLDLHAQNLPTQLTPLIGREKELAALEKLLASRHTRIVTLTGPGGMGKTRLGLQAAADLIEDFRHGVFFIDLAPLSDPELVIPAIARVVHVRETGGRTLLAELSDGLKEKCMLLLLDNFEQVVGAAPHVAALISSCPQLKFVVTSRESLSLRGEQVFAVPPLELPHPLKQRSHTAKSLTQYESVRLFIERATAINQEFQLSNENAPAVAEICVRLDGMPLAIELAAARVRLLPAEEILKRLGSRLSLLTMGARDLPDRQRTLRATIDWSYELLDRSARSLLMLLSVFSGGFSLEAAESLCKATHSIAMDPMDGMESLVNKSLLLRDDEAGSEPRLRMLETIREYSLEKLETDGDVGAFRDAHAAYYLGTAEKAEFQGRQQKIWLRRIEADWENIRSALEWFERQNQTESLARIAVSMFPFWEIRCFLRDGKEWLARALDRSRDLPVNLHARLLHASGVMARQQGDYEASQKDFELSLEEYAAIEDERGTARVMADIGMGYYRMNKLTEARDFCSKARELALHLKDAPLAAIAETTIGSIEWREGSYETSHAHFAASREIFRIHGYRREEAKAINNDGITLSESRDYVGALRCFQEAVEIQEDLGDTDDLRRVYNNIADTYHHLEDYPQAGMYYSKLLALAQDRGDPRYISTAYAGLAEVDLAMRKPEEATQNARAALAAVRHIGKGEELGMAHRILGDISLFKGNPRAAEIHYRLSIPLLEDAKETSELKKAVAGCTRAEELQTMTKMRIDDGKEV